MVVKTVEDAIVVCEKIRVSRLKQFFIVHRHHDEPQWEDSIWNPEDGFATRADAEALMRKVSEIPANDDFAYRVVKRV